MGGIWLGRGREEELYGDYVGIVGGGRRDFGAVDYYSLCGVTDIQIIIVSLQHYYCPQSVWRARKRNKTRQRNDDKAI